MPIVDGVLDQSPEAPCKKERSFLDGDGNDADLLPLERVRFVRELYGTVRLTVHELLKVIIRNMLSDTNNICPPSLYFLNTDQDVSIAVSPSICEGKNILEHLALVVVGCSHPGILVPLVVERS